MNLTENYRKTATEALSQTKIMLDTRLEVTEIHARALISNDNFDSALISFLTKPSTKNTVTLMGTVSGYLEAFEMGNELIASSMIFADNKFFDRYIEGRKQDFSFETSVFYEALKNLKPNEKAIKWLPTMIDPVYISSKKVIPCVRQFTVVGSSKPCYLVYQLSQDYLKDIVFNKQTFFDQIIVLNSSKDIIIGDDLESVEILKTLLTVNQNQFTLDAEKIELDGKKYFITSVPVKNTDWLMIGLKDESEMLDSLADIRNNIFIIAGIVGCLSMGVLFIISNKFTQDIRKLEEKMRYACEGHLSTRFLYPYKNEIGSLAESFNYMLGQIETLIANQNKHIYQLQRERRRLVEIQKQKRKAELQALQAQINPHFLYNTLNTLTWQAVDCGAEDVYAISSSLGKFFRISLSRGAEIISLSDELEQVESYLDIQSRRYKNKLAYSIDVPDSFKNYRILKLVLQPLVENAIYHGIKEKKVKGKIDITAKRSEENGEPILRLFVTDDGVGITPEKVEILNKGFASPIVPQSEGYGIYNVNERIRLYYGSNYGLKITSKKDVYTQVEIKIPVLKKEVEDV
jgi:two-component system sensor histidine kinase YesM